MTVMDVLGQFKRILLTAVEIDRMSDSTKIPRWPVYFVEMLRLRMGPGKLSPGDYRDLGLFKKLVTFAEKQTYVSNYAIPKRLNSNRWSIVGDDKLLTYDILEAQSLSYPEILAIYHPYRFFNHSLSIKTPSALRSFLSEQSLYPIIAKPVQGIYSRGFYLLDAYCQESGMLMVSGQRPLSLDSFIRTCDGASSGYIFQQVISPPDILREITGSITSTLRMILLIKPDGPKLVFALWKIAVPPNSADNYWREGNIGVNIDIDSGVTTRAVSGLGHNIVEIHHHPVSGKPLLGFDIPQWEQIVTMAEEAAKSFPGIPIQAWDVAISSQGPQFLDLNIVGSQFLPQMISGCGLLKGEYGDFISP